MDIYEVTNLDDLIDRGHQAHCIIINAGLPKYAKQAIYKYYPKMCKDGMCSVSIISSATAEDLAQASFAGQQEYFLNIFGPSSVAKKVLEYLASDFTDRNIAWRVHKEFDLMFVKGEVAVQMMVRSDLDSSGVDFTLNPDTGFRDVLVLTGSCGIVESVFTGKVEP